MNQEDALKLFNQAAKQMHLRMGALLQTVGDSMQAEIDRSLNAVFQTIVKNAAPEEAKDAKPAEAKIE